jgi:hypothetical protein
VIGGLLAFGVIGLFIGPVVLAVAYTLRGRTTGNGGAGEPAQEAGLRMVRVLLVSVEGGHAKC